MSISPRSVLHVSLFALALALGVVLALDQGRPTTGELEAREENLLPVVRRDELTALRVIDRSGKNPELLVRRVIGAAGSARYVLEGEASTQSDLDPAAVDGLLSALEFAKWHEPPRTIGAGELAELGALDLEVRLEMGAVTARMLLGGAPPSRPNLRQIEVTATGAPRRVGLVSASLVERIGRDRRAFESRLLLPAGRDRTESLTIARGEGSVTLRSDGRGFVFDGPSGERRRVGRGSLDRVFFQLARTSIEAHAPTDSGDAPQTLALRQRTRATSSAPSVEYALSLGGDCPGHPELVRAVRTTPSKLSGCVPASILTGLTSALHSLEDRSLVPLGADEIDHLIVESGSGNTARSVDLVRDGAEFVLRGPVERSVGLDPGNSFLEALLEAKAPAASDAGLAPTARLRVFGHPPGATETAEFVVELLGQTDTASWSVARRMDDGVLLQLDPATAWALSKDATWFESLELLSVEPDWVQSFVTIAAAGKERLVRDAGDFTLTDGSPADRSLVGAALALLHPLTALRALPPERGDPTERSPVITLEVTLKDGSAHTIVVESRVRGGYAARVDEKRGRFVLPVRTVSTWLRSLADRSPATLIPADYTKVTLTSGTLDYLLLREGEHLTRQGEADDGFGEAVEEALLGFVPIAARRGKGPVDSPRVLAISVTDTSGKQTSFAVYGPTTFEGLSAYELTVDAGARGYLVEAGVVQALLDLL